MTRRYARALERKGCLHRIIRVGNTNRFDLEPLFDKLLRTAQGNVRAGEQGG